MKTTRLSSLFKQQMTRKEFLGLSVFALASVFGIVGILEELKSHAATPFLSEEAESGTITAPATIVTDTAASSGKAVKFMASSSNKTSNPPPQAALTVDFRSTVHTLDKWSVGSTISTYSGNGQGNINASTSWRTKLTALGPLAWRIPLRYNSGNPGSSAGGAQTSGDAATYITNIRAMGGTPYPIIGGNSSDNSEAASDVSGLVHYFNDNNGSRAGGKLERLIIGNEPENASASAAYIAALPSLAAAAKGADSAILVAAPAASYWDSSLIQQVAKVTGVDILGYHAYDGGNTDGSTGFPVTSQYHTHMADMLAMGKSIVGCEEVNWHYDYENLSAFYDWHNLCFIASVIGQVITGGGHVNHYSDSNGPLGLLNDGSGQNQPGSLGDPLPAYWGIGMWTGMNGQFLRYGAHTVPATSTVSNVDCFATDNGKIIIVNKDNAAHAITLGLGGRDSGIYSVWQTVQSSPTSGPKKIITGSSYSSSLISLNLPAGTVSSVELET